MFTVCQEHLYALLGCKQFGSTARLTPRGVSVFVFFFPLSAVVCRAVPDGGNKEQGLQRNPFLANTFPCAVTAEVASSSLVVPAIFDCSPYFLQVFECNHDLEDDLTLRFFGHLR